MTAKLVAGAARVGLVAVALAGTVGPGVSRAAPAPACSQRPCGTQVGQPSADGQLLDGGAITGTVGLFGGGVATSIAKEAGRAAITVAAAAIAAGARYALQATARVIGATTRPDLESTWFSDSYWRMAGVSALLTLPFLFAAAIQAMIHSDLTLLLRAAFGYLPLGMLAVGVAAPVTMLLLAATDEMSSLVSSASSQDGSTFSSTRARSSPLSAARPGRCSSPRSSGC